MKIILGAVISMPPVSAGCAWNRLQYFLGLLQLGHDVRFLEEVKPRWSVDDAGQPCSYADSVNRRAFISIMRQFGLLHRACQLYDGGAESTGLSPAMLRAFADEADLLIDISGHVTTPFVLDGVARRAYFDHDPVYTQLWRAEYGKTLDLDRYDVFLTVGLNIGTAHSHVPDCGIRWHASLPPVLLDLWTPGLAGAPDEPGGRFTTVASFAGYGDLCYRGEWYRSKYDEFRRFADLPHRSGQQCEVLLKDFRDEDDRIRLLREGGWAVRRSPECADLAAYRRYIARSRGEIGITKGAYVKGRSGWFSDRTASYLASGRPCLVQSTGFERCLPVGEGLLTFEDMEQAVAGMEAIQRDHHRHRRAALELAAAYLDYRKVLPALLEDCLRSPPGHPAAAGSSAAQEANRT